MNALLAQRVTKANKKMSLVQGDITQERVDAIVNAANSMLMHGGGVAGAIVRKGGQIIQEESNRLAPISVGNVAVTSGGALPCRYVIHAVGPMFGEGSEDAKLISAVQKSLAKADEMGLLTLSFPAISSGIFGFPKDRCAAILCSKTLDYLESNPNGSLQEVRFCLIDEPTLEHFKREFDKLSA